MNLFLFFTLLVFPFSIMASDLNSKNFAAVVFGIFVFITLLITYFASKKSFNKSNYYAAGGKISGLQNGLAIAGDYMSAASFLGISGLVFFSGFDGLIYSIGFLVGWPIILFLIAEKLKNLGKYTFADVTSTRLTQSRIRILSASGTLVTVIFYLIAQMVGAGSPNTNFIWITILLCNLDSGFTNDYLCKFWWNDSYNMGTNYKSYSFNLWSNGSCSNGS